MKAVSTMNVVSSEGSIHGESEGSVHSECSEGMQCPQEVNL